MKKVKHVLMLSSLFFTVQSTAQVLKTADSLMMEGLVEEAKMAYKEEYQSDTLNQTCLYNLACVMAISGQSDSAFQYLYRLMKINPTEAPLADADLANLRSKKEWQVYEDKLVNTIQTKYDHPIADEVYARKLWELNARDQRYYREIGLIERKKDPSDTSANQLWNMKRQINSENLQQLEQLVRKKGWPMKTMVGSTAANAAFLVVQHSDLKTQKKYLPTIKKLCEEREAEWQSYALMYDRIQVSENKPQRYGSQVNYNSKTQQYELFPLEDDKKVDAWRKEAGMIPLADYLAHWDIQWPEKK
ncbi:DUF6624 domain-containing protein [Rurimicrobium arvi]|uniref:Tetratricopeptide repeat protein n=1 Tax=Rurimicrobium arvi TaxID=2049916 RepID=A0ABP8MGS5_9BACT